MSRRRLPKWSLRAPRVRLAIAALALAGAGTLHAGAREDFLAAERALKRGDSARFEQLAAGLTDYPLYPYLGFARLKRRLGSASDAEIEAFLDAHADTPLADRLRLVWLKRLAKRGQWETYLRAYIPDDSTERRCQYLHALIETGEAPEALHQVEPLWLVGRSQPDACDPLFAAWRAAGGLTADLAWGRIARAMEAGRTRLARYLGRYLPASERTWLDRWLAVHEHPERLTRMGGLASDHPQRGPILAHAIERLARRSPPAAADALDGLEERYPLPPVSAQKAAAAVGLAMAEDGNREGLPYLDRVKAAQDNWAFQERRLRAAMGLGAWPQVAAWVDALPDGEHKAEHWLYWRARALEILQQPAASRELYATAAEERSLWGFLSAERLGIPYRFDHRATPVSEEILRRVEEGPAGRRIAELRALDRTLDMRRELHHLADRSDADELKAVAVLAQRWDFPDQAIFTLAKTGYWDDLELRFPLLHRSIVRERARSTGLDESWIYAVLRQESAFNPGAVSPAGALGLMQLMPATARDTARSLGRPAPGRIDLLDPRQNITLGSSYLARMQSRFDGNPVLAAAAYNAGPHRVERWLPTTSMDADVWAAIIPFRETRGYVRRVLAYRVIYDYRLGQEIEPLSEAMRPIGRGAALSNAEPRPADGAGG